MTSLRQSMKLPAWAGPRPGKARRPMRRVGIPPFIRPITSVAKPAVPGAREVVPGLNPRLAATLRGLNGLSGPFDFLKNIIPEKTIVGKAIRGDTKGAAQDAAKWGAQNVAPLINRGQRPQGVPATGEPQPQYAEPVRSSPGVNMPLLLASLGVGALGVFLLVRQRRG